MFRRCRSALSCLNLVAQKPAPAGVASAQLQAAALALLALLACAPAARGQTPRGQTPSGSNDERHQRDAVRSIPYKELDKDGKAKVSAVLSNVSFFRRMPTQVIRCDPDLYLFMLRHLDVTVDIWKQLGISNISLSRTGPHTFRAVDSSGSRSDIQFLYSSPDTQLVYAVGSYAGPVFSRPIKGGCLLLLKTGYMREPDGYYYITTRLDTFFRIDHVGLELVTKTFESMVGASADHNYLESLSFLNQLSHAAESRSTKLQRIAAQVKAPPSERQQFINITQQVADKAEQLGQQKVANAGPDVNAGQRIPPPRSPQYNRPRRMVPNLRR